MRASSSRLQSPVVAVTGDGGFLMNSQELETARRLGTAFVTMVWTDNRYGVIALNQERRFGRTFGATFTNPDLVKYAEAFGLPGFRVERPDDLLPTLRRALACDGPSLIEVPIDPAAHHELGQAHRAAAPEAGQVHRPPPFRAAAVPPPT